MIGKLLLRQWHEPSPALRYAIPVVAVAGATLVTTSSLVSFGQTPPFLLAIVMSGLFGGRGPALFALVLSIPLGEAWVFVYPPHLIPGFTVVGLFVGWISGLQYETTKALRKSSDALREKVGELEQSNVALRAEMAAREKAEAELLRSRTELAHMNRVMQLGELGASIAHEITQPLATIKMNASVARRYLDATPPDPNETRQLLVSIQDSVQRAVDVLARIRALAKKSPIQTTQVDINATITNVLALVRSEIELNRITVRTELKGEALVVQGDPVQLQQVVLNLVMNAMDAMTASEPRELLLSTQQARDKVHVSVCDSGCGFEPGPADRLFDAFYTTKAAGMGMGLAICRSIIQSHGGQLSARDNAPRGAIFEFELPLQQAPAGGA